MGGSAVIDAANNLLDSLRARAAARLAVPPQDIRLADGLACAADGRTVTWGELATQRLSVEGVFASSKPTYSYGTAAAHVAA